jgi:hypothetical protein
MSAVIVVWVVLRILSHYASLVTNCIQFGLFRFNQHSIMVLKACQQHGAYQTGVEQLDISRLTWKQPSQSNESSGCSDHLHSAKRVNKGFLNLALYFITVYFLLHDGAEAIFFNYFNTCTVHLLLFLLQPTNAQLIPQKSISLQCLFM